MNKRILLLLIGFTIFMNLFCGETQTKKDKEKDILATLVINGLTYNLKQSQVAPAAAVSAACKTGFSTLISSLSACKGCHPTMSQPDISDTDAGYASLTSSAYITPGDPTSSKLYTKVASGTMAGYDSTGKAKTAISTWITSCK
jgi:hypothetical protein